jgi:hypothetical protein
MYKMLEYIYYLLGYDTDIKPDEHMSALCKEIEAGITLKKIYSIYSVPRKTYASVLSSGTRVIVGSAFIA